MKVITVVGARPQFIKVFLVSKELRKNKVKEVIVHTGQHYDYNMSGIFFSQFNIPKPLYNLNLESDTGIKQISRILNGLEKVFKKEKPSLVLVYGDTNSTLAGALCAAQRHIRLAHIEAGLRSYNKNMPEEINRVITDRISDLLFCPTETSVKNLKKEGICKNVFLVGDVMYDSLRLFIKNIKKPKTLYSYILATIHRAENTDNTDKLRNIFEGLGLIKKRIIIPLHPRTFKVINRERIKVAPNIEFIKPVSYSEMLKLEINAEIIITDSGGVQKEAFIFGRPCITLREETEWLETVKTSMNKLVGCIPNRIVRAAEESIKKKSINIDPSRFYGQGNAHKKIVSILLSYLKKL